MSKLRSINTAFWSDTWIETLEPNYKLLFLYLVTNEKTNMLGIYEASIRKISFETGLDTETVQKGLKEFERVSKVKYENNYIILVNYMKHQKYNTNMKKSAIDCYNNLPKELKINGLEVDKSNASKGFERLSKGFGMVSKIEVEDEVEIENEVEDEIKDLETFYDIEILFNYYLKQDRIINSVVSNKKHKLKDKEHLQKILREFTDSLQSKGRFKETFKEYASYFLNWLNIQNKKTKDNTNIEILPNGRRNVI